MLQGSVTYTSAPPPVWTYIWPMLLWGAVILFSALQFIALWRVGSILRRILFRMEHPLRGPQVPTLGVEATDAPTGAASAPDMKQN